MILITGAAGFIGSSLVHYFNQKGQNDIIIADKFDRKDKEPNWINTKYEKKIDRDELLTWFKKYPQEVDFVLHIGARTDTSEKDTAIFDALNLNYSKALCQICTEHQIPFIYASSAATYGLGEQGYDDNTAPDLLKPLNPYGDSKNDFDKWLISNKKQPPFWAGLKFFNVYGWGENHKGRMASVVYHSFQQIQKTGTMNLFRSHRTGIKDGAQSRDFIYIKDLLSIIDFLMTTRPNNGLYNVGTGVARSFYDLAKTTFLAMNKEPNIGFIDTPKDIRATYQYFTEADISKLKSAGYNNKFYSLEEGIYDYITLLSNKLSSSNS